MCYIIPMNDGTVQEALQEISTLINAMNREMVRDAHCSAVHHSATIPQFGILIYLCESDCCKMTDISRTFDIKLSSVTGMMDRLEHEGYVKRIRDKDDRRIVRVTITDKGKKAVNEVKNKRKKHLEFVLKILTGEERRSLVGIMKKISIAVNDLKEERKKQ
jgi:MarR family transcriptional regulator, organic hydroperoxide resistance regulator